MSKEQMIYEIIKQIFQWFSDRDVEVLYEVVVNGDYDYIPNLFINKEQFEEFIEKWTPKKCCVKEEDND